MARVCQLSGKGPQSGNKRSHSCIATPRKWGVNLQKVKLADGTTVKASARAIRTLKKAN